MYQHTYLKMMMMKTTRTKVSVSGETDQWWSKVLYPDKKKL